MSVNDCSTNLNQYKLFSYFGYKGKIAGTIWRAFGKVDLYIEPFFGGGAVLFANPYWKNTHEIVGDLYGYITNFWRAIKFAPDEVVKHLFIVKNQIDFYASLKHAGDNKDLVDSMLEDRGWYDAKIAACWLYAVNLDICSKQGIFQKRADGGYYPGVIDVNSGLGIFRKSLRDYSFEEDELVPSSSKLKKVIREYSKRLHDVVILHYDWKKTLGIADLSKFKNFKRAFFLDPPYGYKKRDRNIYILDSLDISNDVRQWCIQNGDKESNRIALCDYGNEHDILVERYGWSKFNWEAHPGFCRDKERRKLESVYFSPYCLNTESDTHDTLFNFNS